jgi:hypothetical protein
LKRHQLGQFKIRIVLFSKHRDEVNNIFFFILAQTITDIESVLAVVLGLAKANFPKTPK